ncbi:heme ABC transporter substrate-binding protein IsdE [Shouchella sp. JSM 1781072]|uniref:heme ABC transporter substrate-binding protein IsdE n=1 Tax=Shouchella sp. JSM 1781072 TaxID=3344581 RepID=UPI0035C028C8
MQKALFGVMLICVFLIGACQPASESIEGGNSPSSASDQADRIVATTVSATELADALDLELVGIPSSYKALPERYDDVTELGNPMSPDAEQIRQLQADVVWSVTTLQGDLEESFTTAGIEAEFLNFQSVEEMSHEIERIGKRYDREKEASALVETFDRRLSELEQKNADRNEPSVLILMGVPGSYLVATEHSYIGDLVELAGGTLAVEADENVEYLASNTEYLQQANPDLILRAAHGMPEEVIEMFDEEFKSNDVWKHFQAVEKGRVYDLEESLFGTTGNIAVLEALDALEEMLYPEEDEG